MKEGNMDKTGRCKLRATLQWASLVIVPACYIVLGSLLLSAVRAAAPGTSAVDFNVAFDLVLALAGLWLWKRIRANRECRELSNKGRAAVVAYCLAMFLIAQCAATIVYSLTADPSFSRYRTAMSGGNVWLSTLLTVAVAPIVEEVLFRGIVFESLGSRLPLWAAALVSSVGFAATHGTLMHMLPATLMGLSCCAVYVLTGKLRNSIALHMAYNVFSLVAPYLTVPSALFAPLVTIPVTFAMGALCCVAIRDQGKWRAKLCRAADAASPLAGSRVRL